MTDRDHDIDDIPRTLLAGIALSAIVITATLMLLVTDNVPRHFGALLVIVVGIPAVVAALGTVAKNWRTPHAPPH